MAERNMDTVYSEMKRHASYFRRAQRQGKNELAQKHQAKVKQLHEEWGALQAAGAKPTGPAWAFSTKPTGVNDG